ncbi:MAG: lipid II flippase MurJ, partial [Candidatus Peregrinibacteria bacterium]
MERHDFKTILFHSSWSLTLASGLSYGLGLLRDRILTHTYGLSRTLDVFNASFDLPDNLYEIMMGAMLSAAFLPIFAKQYDRTKQLGYRYAHQIMSWGLLLLMLVCIGFGIALPLFTKILVPGFEPAAQVQYILFTRILLISPVLFGLSNLYGKMMLSFKEFLWYGLSPAFYNLGIVIGAAVLAPRFGPLGLVAGPLLGAL